MQHEHYMARALQLARSGLYTTHPNPRVGCMIVSPEGEVVAEGWHEYAGGPHAEVAALKQAGDKASGATAYVTLEPCSHHGATPPCCEALIKAGIARVVVAMQDPNPAVNGNGIKQLQKAGIEVLAGCLEDPARALNPGFIKRFEKNKPYVRLKMAASLDGRIAMASGESRWITSEAARRDVQHLRAQSSAILTGVSTVLADDPRLTVRNVEIKKQPVRIILDSSLRLPVGVRLLREPGEAWVVTTEGETDKISMLERSGAKVITLPTDIKGGGVSLDALMLYLAQQGINEVLVEAGLTLAGACLQAGIVDELILYLAPRLLGDGAKGLFSLPGLEKLEDSIELDIKDIRMVGKDMRITVNLNSPSPACGRGPG